MALGLRRSLGVKGLNVSDYLERLIAVGRGVEDKHREEEWMVCNLCGVRLKARNVRVQDGLSARLKPALQTSFKTNSFTCSLGTSKPPLIELWVKN